MDEAGKDGSEQPEVVGGLDKGSFHGRWRPVGSGKNERREMELPGTDNPLWAGERWHGSCRVKWIRRGFWRWEWQPRNLREREMSDATDRVGRRVRGGASPQETGWAEEGLLRACTRVRLPAPPRGMERVTGDCRAQWG